MLGPLRGKVSGAPQPAGAWRGVVGEGSDVDQLLRFWCCGPRCGVAGRGIVGHQGVYQGVDGHGGAWWAVSLCLLGVKGHRHLLLGLLLWHKGRLPYPASLHSPGRSIEDSCRMSLRREALQTFALASWSAQWSDSALAKPEANRVAFRRFGRCKNSSDGFQETYNAAIWGYIRRKPSSMVSCWGGPQHLAVKNREIRRLRATPL